MQSTEPLKQEHGTILAALSVLDAFAGRGARGEPVPAPGLDTLVSFFREFADRSHHEKEERALFPALEAHGMPHDTGPLAVMLLEHAQGRELAEAAPAIQADTAARARFVQAARRFVELLGAHIQKENLVLFRMADGMLRPEDDAEVSAAFAQQELEVLGEDGAARHREAVATLHASLESPDATR